MELFQEILNKYKEFATYLDSLDLKKMKSTYSREELKEFYQQLSQIHLRSFPFEISELIDEMKKEQYPQLLGVHHYPEIEKIQFISKEKKIELDKYLSYLRVGNYVYNLWRYVNPEKKKLLEDFLLSHGIIEKRYFFTCPHHPGEKLTTGYTLEEFNRIKEAIINFNDDILEDFYEDLYCEECEDIVMYKNWNDRYVKVEFVLSKERDKTYDNI